MGESAPKQIVVAILVGVVGPVVAGVILWAVLPPRDSAPGLDFVKVEQFEKYTDLIVQSKSARPFLIHGYDLLVQQVLRKPPARPRYREGPAAPDTPVTPRPNQGSRGRLFQWRRLVSKECSYVKTGAPLPVDDIVFYTPNGPETDKWMSGHRETMQIKAYEPERIRIWTVNDEMAGAEYLASVRVIYGDASNQKRLVVKNVRVNVVAAECP